FDFFASPGAAQALLADDAALLRGVYAGLSEEAIEEYLGLLGNEPTLTAALHWYGANIVDRRFVTDEIGTITVPTLYVWSDGDDAVCPEGAEATENYVTGPYRYEVLNGIGHWIPELADETVSGWLVEHLASG
ncbi:MAG: alpha/beta hydrolase, partial [Deltaproteobacteria bacterium]|nr:alpha/beta hydrolase [Deltaproteobacteria bacterium]